MVKGKVIFRCRDEEDLFEKFAKYIGDKYKEKILLKINRSYQNEDMVKWWSQMLETEPRVIEKNAYGLLNQISYLASNPAYDKFFQHKFGFPNYHVIRITESSGFFKDLTKKDSINIPTSEEYLLDLRKFTVTKKEYPSFTNL